MDAGNKSRLEKELPEKAQQEQYLAPTMAGKVPVPTKSTHLQVTASQKEDRATSRKMVKVSDPNTVRLTLSGTW